MARIGRELTDLFFRPYTRKMWALDLEDMDAAVVKRIPIRFDDEDRYFADDRYQLLPRDGYAAAFRSILDHPNISVSLSVPFDRAMLAGYRACFNSMPIDEFFDFAHGALPYRSIRFYHRAEPVGFGGARAAVVNFTDAGRFTRETDWSRLPGHRLRATGYTTVTLEEPCDYAENGYERYYPVKTADRRFQQAYDRYKTLAEVSDRCIFIGRCGTYQYLDMHQVINQSLASVRRWLARNG
jgi:UDP-galactopyranose mutase